MVQATCVSCLMKTDIISVHDELPEYDGTKCIWTYRSTAALVQYCFNLKIENLDTPYGMCLDCVATLTEATSFKQQLLTNISAMNSNDAVRNKTSTKRLIKQDALLVRKKTEWTEVIERSNTQFNIDLNKTNFTDVEIEEKSTASKTNDNSLKRPKSRNIVTNTTKRTQQTKLRVETSKSLNKKIRNEFILLHRDCKDFYIFSWFQSRFKCAVCKESYSDLNTFKIHVRKHTMKQSEAVYPEKEIYRGPHLKVDVSTMKCRYCNEPMIELEQFRNHLSLEHNINTEYLFSRILPFHLNKDDFKCGICNKVCISIVNLNIHMNEHCKSYICDYCTKPFATLHRLKSHIFRIHMPGTYKCSKCDEIFESVAKRQYHSSIVHRRRMNLCPHCPEKFTYHFEKIKHLAQAHNEEERRYKCHICPSKFLTSGQMTTHIRRIHLGERNHICTLCGKGFFTTRDLKEHTVKHTGKRLFICEICDKAFAISKTLLAHKKIHDESKRKYSCEFCKREFLHKNSLRVHRFRCKKKIIILETN